MVGHFEPDALHDEHRARVLELVKQKAAGRPLKPAAERAVAPITDLSEALKRSLAAQKGRAKPARRPRKAA
jgi:DNA end-binding protein Ku